MPFTPAELAEHRAKLRRNGICVSCHNEPVRPTYATCGNCIDRINVARDRRRLDYKHLGLCIDCSTVLPDTQRANHMSTNYVRCQVCCDKINEHRMLARGLR